MLKNKKSRENTSNNYAVEVTDRRYVQQLKNSAPQFLAKNGILDECVRDELLKGMSQGLLGLGIFWERGVTNSLRERHCGVLG